MNHHNSVLELKNLTVSFRQGFRAETQVLHGINFKVPKNKIFGFLGPNGAGKTTTIKTILGLIPKYAGEIIIFGEPCSPAQRNRIGFSPENAYFSPLLTPKEVINSMGKLSGLEDAFIQNSAKRWLERLKLSHVNNSPIGTFSKGMRQRLNIIQALLHDPEFLILDEPTSGLDPIGRQEIKYLIQEMRDLNKTVLVSTHNLLEAQQICDEICIINNGRIISEGNMKELLAKNQNLEEYFIQKVSEVSA